MTFSNSDDISESSKLPAGDKIEKILCPFNWWLLLVGHSSITFTDQEFEIFKIALNPEKNKLFYPIIFHEF